MAIRPMIADGAGAVAQLPDVQLDEDGRLTEQAIKMLVGRVQDIVRLLNGGLTLGLGTTAHRAGNFNMQWLDVLMPGVADTEIVIPHGLGRRPIGYLVVQRDRSCCVYSDAVGSWGNDMFYLKCDTADATVRLLVF